MKLAIYSDLQLEFGGGFQLPDNLDANVLILAGNIITFDHCEPLSDFSPLVPTV